jgi:hypothetical protein
LEGPHFITGLGKDATRQDARGRFVIDDENAARASTGGTSGNFRRI